MLNVESMFNKHAFLIMDIMRCYIKSFYSVIPLNCGLEQLNGQCASTPSVKSLFCANCAGGLLGGIDKNIKIETSNFRLSQSYSTKY